VSGHIDWPTVGVIAAIVFGVIGAAYAARSSNRETARMHAEDKRLAIADAVKPYQSQIDTQNRTIIQLGRTIEMRDARIDKLEDDLRQGRRT
jgi:hypothetical protein